MKQLAIVAPLVLLVASIGMAQDDAASGSPQTSPLEELDWMVGEWLDEGEVAKIVTSCSWMKNRKFMTRSFKVAIDDQLTLEGTQMVGWDPIAGQIRSWTFDSEGGFGRGRWIKDGNRWLVKMSYVLADGSRASAINVITYVDNDTLRWQSIDREIAGELQPNIPEVTVVRQKEEKKGADQGAKEESK